MMSKKSFSDCVAEGHSNPPTQSERITVRLQSGLRGQKEMIVEDQHSASVMGNMGGINKQSSITNDND